MAVFASFTLIYILGGPCHCANVGSFNRRSPGISNRDAVLYLIDSMERPGGIDERVLSAFVHDFQAEVVDLGYRFQLFFPETYRDGRLDSDLRRWADIGLLEVSGNPLDRLIDKEKIKITDYGKKYLDGFGKPNLYEKFGPKYQEKMCCFLEGFKSRAFKTPIRI